MYVTLHTRYIDYIHVTYLIDAPVNFPSKKSCGKKLRHEMFDECRSSTLICGKAEINGTRRRGKLEEEKRERGKGREREEEKIVTRISLHFLRAILSTDHPCLSCELTVFVSWKEESRVTRILESSLSWNQISDLQT